MAEKRVDTEDGNAYTYDELAAFYKGKYKKKEIEAYWETLKPAKGKKSKGKAKAEPEEEAPKGKKSKGKAKAEPKEEAAEEPKGKKSKAKAEPKEESKGKKAEPKAKAKAKDKAEQKPRPPRKTFKVTVCGGSGGIGQPLSLLMAQNRFVSELSVFDLNIAMVPPEGVAADLNHIETNAKVKGYVMEVGKNPIDFLEEALTGSSLVLVPAGMPRKPGQSRDDLFKVNADIAKGIVEAAAKYCPDANPGVDREPGELHRARYGRALQEEGP